MKPRLIRIATLLVIVFGGATVAEAAGEAVNGFPNWAERVQYEWTNRARSDPQFDLANCPGNNCLEASSTCYPPMPPLAYNLNLNRAARFHSDHMLRAGYFSHTSNCVIRTDINSVYPAPCDGSSACACSGAGSTAWNTRVSRFGTSGGAEIIARGPNNYDPSSMFYVWLHEAGDVTTCTSTSRNGHRYAILKRTGAIGYGYSADGSWNYATGDFGSGTTPTKVVSGAHYPKQAASVEAWANWYDPVTVPLSASVVVDGVSSPMSLMRGTLNNGAWRAVLNGVGTGCRRYYFSFTDATGTHRYPTTGTYGIGGSTCADWEGAAPPPPADTIGVHRPSTGRWFMRFANVDGAADLRFNFGAPYDRPIVGDWNGDGVDTIGVVRGNVFYLRNANDLGGHDQELSYGNPTDVPIAGDWNGDGVDTVGVFRDGIFFLRTTNSAAFGTIRVIFGQPGDIPVIGDWNGDGVDSIGVFRPSEAIFYLRNSNSSGGADAVVLFGAGTDVPVVGDWNGDGVTTIGVRRGHIFYLRNANTPGGHDVAIGFGDPPDVPISGKWR